MTVAERCTTSLKKNGGRNRKVALLKSGMHGNESISFKSVNMLSWQETKYWLSWRAPKEFLWLTNRGEPVEHKDSSAYWLLTNSERNDYSEPCHRRVWTTYLQFERDCDNQEETRVLFNVELLLTYFHQQCQFHNGTWC